MSKSHVKMRFPIFSFIIAILLISAMFFFSSQNANDSDALSGNISEFLSTVFNFGDKDLMNHFIRKLAHFSLYSLLGICITGIMRYITPNKAAVFFAVIAIGVAAAIFDEAHQLFSSGRSGNIPDIILDSAGIVFGFLIRCLSAAINKKRSR